MVEVRDHIGLNRVVLHDADTALHKHPIDRIKNRKERVVSSSQNDCYFGLLPCFLVKFPPLLGFGK